MEKYLYLSLTPEALISSMLPPKEFGNYLAVGSKKRTRGEAIFFEVDQSLQSEYFPLDSLDSRCVLHKDGSLKSSVYLSIYRVLEHMPLNYLKNLFLVTDDGRVLELEKDDYVKDEENSLHLYQQLSPVTPRIASKYEAADFMKLVTDTSKPISVPKLVFVELILNGLSKDPVNGSADNLPYSNIQHLKDCLMALRENPQKPTKTVIRYFKGGLLYRTCKNGFFIGDYDTLLYYPFPSIQDLESKYYSWWKSALTKSF